MTMDERSIDDAARHLHTLLVCGPSGARLPLRLRPQQPLDGWRIQRRVSKLRGRAQVGWKCALPAADRWMVAALHEALPSGARLRAPSGPASKPRIEPEFAFELRHDLPPRDQPYSAAEVNAAIGNVRLAVEVLGCRYDDASQASGPELMADSLWHQTLLLGPEIADLPAEPALKLTLALPGRADLSLSARHRDGDPRRPLQIGRAHV